MFVLQKHQNKINPQVRDEEDDELLHEFILKGMQSL